MRSRWGGRRSPSTAERGGRDRGFRVVRWAVLSICAFGLVTWNPHRESANGDGNMDRLVSSSIQSQKSLCMMCMKAFGAYTCPRCNANYCSQKCFNDTQNHGQCFHKYEEDTKAKLEDNMRSHTSKESRERMLDILRRQTQDKIKREEEEIDGETWNELSRFDKDMISRLGDINLDDSEVDADDILARLPPQMQKQLVSNFELWLKTDRNAEDKLALEMWLPYWMTHQGKTLKSVRHKEALLLLNETHQKSSIPRPAVVPAFKEFKIEGNRPVDPRVKYILTNIIVAYAYVTRLENGWHQGDRASRYRSCVDLLECSGGLRGEIQDDIEEAVHRAVYDCGNIHENPSDIAYTRSRAVLDSTHILLGEVDDPLIYALPALSDMINLFNKTSIDLRSNITEQKIPEGKYGLVTKEKSPKWLLDRGKTPPKDKERLLHKFLIAQNKCEFLLSWLRDNPRIMAPYVPELLTQYKKIRTEDEDIWRGNKRKEYATMMATGSEGKAEE